jgi:hypothetical protein
VEEDERVVLLLDLAQSLRQPLDLSQAHALVQPYDLRQVEDLVIYTRQTKGLRDPLAFVFKRLRTGELPVLPMPEPEPDYTEDTFLDSEPERVDPALARAHGIWQAALGELQLQMTRGTFNTWLKPTRVIGYENGTPFDKAHDVPFDGAHDVPFDGARSTSPSAGSGRGSRQSHDKPSDDVLDGTRTMPFDGAHGRLYVEVENEYVKDWLSNRLLETIRRTVNSISGETVEIEFVVKGEQHEIEVVRAR